MAAPRPEVLVFLDDVKAHPDDDTPRLILADWLDERGDERGEFLRIQCRLDATPWGEPHGDTLVRRQSHLLARHRDEWTGALQPYILDRHFHRGLLRVNMRARQMEDAAHDGLAATEKWAWVEALTLRELGGLPLTLAYCPLLAGVGALSVRDSQAGGWANSGAGLLASSPHLGRLRSLDLGGCGITAVTVAALGRSPHLGSLRELRLHNNPIGDAGLQALAESPLLAQLTFLDLGYIEASDDGIRALTESPHLSPNVRIHLVTRGMAEDLAEFLRSRLQDRRP
jgi:uncharacterized protein (TIGR02996 family)